MNIPKIKFLKTKKAKVALVATLVLSAVTFLRTIDPVLIGQIRERTFDTYQKLQPRPYGDFPVRIVDIDEASLAEYGQWPWPRTVMASLVKRLSELGAAVIAFDATFAEPDRTSPQRFASQLRTDSSEETQRIAALMARLPDHDKVFADAIAQAPVVLGFAKTPLPNNLRPTVKSGLAIAGVKPQDILPNFHGTATNLPMFDKAAAGNGAMMVSPNDKTGIIRRVPLLFTDGEKIYPNLDVEALRVAQQQKSIMIRGSAASGEMDMGRPALLDLRIGQFVVPVTDIGEMWVYFDRDRPERYVSVKDVLDLAQDDKVRPRIDGQIILIGSSAAGLLDVWPTPLGELVPGTSVHAQAIEQIISQTFLERPDWANGLEIFATVVLSALLAYLLLVLRAEYTALIGIAVLGLGIGLSWIAFTRFGMLLDPVYPSIGAISTYLAVVGALYVFSDKEKKFVQRAFGQYLAPALLAKLVHAPEMMRLGGETKQITLLFMDVRDFTPISEGLTAHELVEFMNHLLSPLSDAIQAELGTIDKYIGDAIMAFWNAPVDVPDHPACACRAALRMRAALADLNERDAFGFKQRGLAHNHVRIGIGLNTGIACVGNMGSQRRFNYSAMGDVVNTTSRIESNTKEIGIDIVISDDTARAAPGFALLEAGELLMKGKSKPVKLFGLVGDEQTAASAGFIALARHHAEMLEAISSRRAPDALGALAQCRELGGALLIRFYNRFEEQIADISAGGTLLSNVAAE
jgi:adenylate cyclase